MNHAEFWALIDRSRTEAAGADQKRALQSLLADRPEPDLRRFDEIFREQLERITPEIDFVATELNGLDDDTFEHFCDWLVGRGEATFEYVLADPGGLPGLPDAKRGEMATAGLRYAARSVLRSRDGS